MTRERVFRPEAILSDIDGTLIDSTAAVNQAWIAWADRYDLDADQILKVCHGRRSADTVAMFIDCPRRVEALAALEALDAANVDVTALPGASALLSSVPSGRWASVTSGSRAVMEHRLRVTGLPVPDVLVSAEDVVRGKPDPEGYAKAAAALGYDVGRCLVIEDAPAGIEAGRRAGATVLGVATSHDVEELWAADAVVRDLTGCSVGFVNGALRVVVTLVVP
ncbi:MAG: HAD-IA family hydrolase [Microthrixaceae bacterium]